MIRLKAAAKTCEFGDYLEGDGTEFVVHALEDALIDRFIAGLSNKKIQQKLLNQTEANFEKMVSVATTMDVTQTEVRAMKPLSQLSVESAETSPLNRVRIKNSMHVVDVVAVMMRKIVLPSIGNVSHVQKEATQVGFAGPTTTTVANLIAKITERHMVTTTTTINQIGTK